LLHNRCPRRLEVGLVFPAALSRARLERRGVRTPTARIFSMNILQINTADDRGGAEKISWQLHRAYRALSHRSWLIVRSKFSDDPDVFVMPNDRYRKAAANFWIRAGNRLNPLIGKARGAGRVRELVQRIGEPARLRN